MSLRSVAMYCCRGGKLEGKVEVDEQELREASGYIRARVRLVEGETATQALQVMVLDARGRRKRYQRADLRYDLKHGYVKLDGEYGGWFEAGGGGGAGVCDVGFGVRG